MRVFRYFVCALLLAASAIATAKSGGVEMVAPGDIEARVKSQKGDFDVLISSLDAKCRPCIGANARFEALASGSSATGKYVRVVWQPWAHFPQEIQSFLNKHHVNAVPARLSFKDGQLVDKSVGEPPVASGQSPVQISGSVREVRPEDAADFIRKSKGTLVVMLSSFETRCDFCMRGNPVFEALANSSGSGSGAGKSQFVRVMYKPWIAMERDPFAQAYKVRGLPNFFTFKDGQAVRRHGGVADVAELQKLLLDGIN